MKNTHKKELISLCIMRSNLTALLVTPDRRAAVDQAFVYVKHYSKFRHTSSLNQWENVYVPHSGGSGSLRNRMQQLRVHLTVIDQLTVTDQQTDILENWFLHYKLQLISGTRISWTSDRIVYLLKSFCSQDSRHPRYGENDLILWLW